MFVQKVAPPGSRVESWTVLGDDDAPVAAIESYLSYLSDIERSPNTVKAYAHDLKDYFVFLAHHGVDWREVRLEDVGEFVAWLRLPPAGRSGQVAVLPSLEPHVGAATINRKLSAVSSFYTHQARHGVDLGELLVTWLAPGRSAWKPFMHHISKSGPRKRRAIALKTPQRIPRVLTASEVQTILDACTRLRDRLLFAVLYDTGMRIGEALGLRHEDLAAAEREVSIHCPGQRKRRSGQDRPLTHDPDRRGPAAALRRLPPCRVRGPGQRPRVRQPVGPSDRARVVLSGCLRPGAAPASTHRHRLRPALVPAHRGHPDAARPGATGGGLHVAGPCIGDHHRRHLRTPHL